MTSNNDVSKNQGKNQGSPNWNWTTKLVAGLALVAFSFLILVQFREFLGPIITAFILAFLIYPIASFLQNKIKIPWRISVGLIYIILLLSFLGLAAWGGLALAEQIQNLIQFIENNIDQLPDLVTELTTRTYQIGPFTFSPSGFNWEEIINQIVATIQPILGRMGSIVGSFAAGAASTVSWMLLIFLVSYFLLSESEGISRQMIRINLPDYNQDLERMGDALNRIWSAFIRGEILVVLISLVIYTIMLGALGIQFFFGLALIAAIGQLIPYLGAWVTWITFGLVALFQSTTPFGLPPGIYMIIVLAVSMLINNIIDNVLRTSIMAENLKVHPALVLLGALVGVQLFGFIGIVIAAPVMASLQLLLNYVIKKLNDQNPWKDFELSKEKEKAKWLSYLEEKWSKIKQWFRARWQKFKHDVFRKRTKEPEDVQPQSNPDE
jgi:predicted PurR-regulated permease PerM